MATRVPLAPVPGRPWRTPRTRAFNGGGGAGAGARKHKMEAQPEGAPLPKKRLTEDAMEDPSWALAANADPVTRTSGADQSRTAPEMPSWEEMEAAPVAEEEEEDAARRRLREIEERIIDDEEDGGDGDGAAGRSGSGLPTLVLSDALKTGLRRDFDGGLPKKIIESMSRPSMELVLWKPLPGFLGERDKMAAAAAKTFVTDAERSPSESLGAAFGSSDAGRLQRTPAQTPPHPPPPLLLYANADPAGGPSAEEEMEL